MTDIILFSFFVLIPFLRIFDGNLLQNIHNIIAFLSIGGLFLGIIFNRLDEYADRMLKYLIPILVSTIAVHFFLETYDSAQIKITLLETGGPLVLIIWLAKRINRGSFKLASDRKYVLVPALLFLLSGLISFALTPYKLQTFEPGLLRRIVYVGSFLAIVYEFNRKEDFMRVLNWVMGSLVIIVVYGIIQAAGLDWHIWAGAFRGTFSTFGNPNFFGAWLVLVLPLVFAKAMLTRKWHWYAMIAAVLYNIYRCGAKGSWLGAAADISVFVVLATLFLIEGNPKVLKRIALGITAAVMLFASVAVTIASMQRMRSITFRLFTWGSTMKMISEPIFVSPAQAFFLGHGIETFRIVYPAYRRPEIFHLEGRHNTQTDHAHNEFMEVFFDEGVFGLTVFIWLLAGIFYVAVKRLSLVGVGKAKTDDEFYLVGLIAGLIGVLTHAFVDVNPRFVSTGYILWVMLGLLVVHSAPLKDEKGRGSAPVPVNYGPRLILVLGLMILGYRTSVQAALRFNANRYHNRAIAHSKRRAWDDALELYDRVQEYHPSFIMAYYFEGNVYNDQLSEAMQAGRRQEAEHYYSQAVDAYKRVRSMFPNYVQLHFQEGMMHLRMDNIEEAERSFRRYINIVDPVFPYSYFRLGMINLQRGDTEKARRYFEEPVRRNPDVPETFLNLASFLRRMGETDEVERVFLEGVEANPEDLDILGALGAFYEEQQRKEDAASIYRRMLELRPGDGNLERKLEELGS